MFHVISCNKYNLQTLRLVNSGTDDADAMLDGDMGECLLCGPCSHVELGPRKHYWKIHSSHEAEQEATEAAWQMVDAEGLDSLYDTSYLPKRPKMALAS